MRRVLTLAAVCLSAPLLAGAAARPSGYGVSVQDEVEVQNLTCDDLEYLVRMHSAKFPDPTLLDLVQDIIDQPQHNRETGKTLLGPSLLRRILDASFSSVRTTGRYGPDTDTGCDVRPNDHYPDPKRCPRRGGDTMSRGQTFLNGQPQGDARPGELALLSLFDSAARLKNCQA